MGQEREGGRRGVAALPCVYSSCTASSRTTVYPPGTYLRRPVHVYLLHGCSSQFALRPLDFRRGAFDARNNFFFFPPSLPYPYYTFSMAEARSTNEKGAMEGSREMVERRRRERGGNHRYSSTFIFQGRIDFLEGNGTELFSRSSFHRGDRKMGNDLDTFLPFPF